MPADDPRKQATVGSTWLWESEPIPPLKDGARMTTPFTIYKRCYGVVWYTYANDLGNGSLDVVTLLKYARLVCTAPVPIPRVAVCAPDCTPAEPCYAPVCPGRREMDVNVSMWFGQQYGRATGLYEWRPFPAFAAPELRCDRDMACGLYRTT